MLLVLQSWLPFCSRKQAMHSQSSSTCKNQPRAVRLLASREIYLVLLLALVVGFQNFAASAQGGACTEQLVARPATDLDPVGYVILRKRWPGSSAAQSEIIHHLPADVKVILLDDQKGAKLEIKKNKIILPAPAKSYWTQDYLPETVFNEEGKPEFVTFKYASNEEEEATIKEHFRSLLLGGEPPPPIPQSHDVAWKLSEFLGWPLRRSEIVMHGGHYLADELGTLFISEKMISLNSKSREELEQELLKLLHGKKVVWMPSIEGEPTGHLDVYAMHLGNNTFLLQKTHSQEPWNSSVERAQEKLESLGYSVKILTASSKTTLYVNSRRLGKRILMPVYAPTSFWGRIRLNEEDQKAKAVFQELGFEVVPIPSEDLEEKWGAVHCLTKTIPCI